ncbi:MAG: PilZ domain-containing protein [Candidatus Omnitrophica bacterium]|nr:PilZ domain-containing protein [Candidatus Omnitrophota bacterium]
MKRLNPKDKRQHPRIESELPIKVAANGYDFSTTTQNVSCLGAYCTITKYIPPFTKVLIKLTLPIGKAHTGVNCKGVVVRSEDEATGHFNIAIFFNDIKENQRKKIEQYVNQFLPKDTAVSRLAC